MASISLSEDDLSCPVCCEIFKDPVLLLCSHSICKVCLEEFWKSRGVRECPVCRKRSSLENPPLNLHLRKLCETFRQEGSQREPLCTLHRSELKLFCEDDKQLVCLVCRDSKLHKKHKFSPIGEAALERKEKLKTKVKVLQEKLDTLKKVQTTCDKTTQHIKVQAQQTERQIKQEFEELRRFLRDEEAARIAALREEERERSWMMKKQTEEINRQIASLSDTIRAIEAVMVTDDITLLQNYKVSMKRAQCTLQDPERLSGALINVAKHLGNLKFSVWESMKEIVQYSPVILDPNTAHPCLVLSEDLTSVRSQDVKQQLPDNPARFDRWVNVLGSEGFKSGTHCWEVEVGEGINWDVGVVTESAKRKGFRKHWHGVWCVVYEKGQYYKLSSHWQKALHNVTWKPQRIRVQLDWDRGELSFYDPDNNTHIHTFTHRFINRVFPCFGSQCTQVPLRIVPLTASVGINM
ncbi:hypothetical protein ACEWY4_022788 [Coilia grayii]|uniref:Zinc-binding protein A33-like n=1 Tax=Coilia grayii TaxID=363190 RepID=A0ABD1J365_9TELE